MANKSYQRCPSCGATLPPNATQCPNCHLSLTGNSFTEHRTIRGNSEAYQPQPQPPQQPPQPAPAYPRANYPNVNNQNVNAQNSGKNKTNILLLVLIGVVLVVGSVIATLLLTGKSDNSDSDKAEAAREEQLDAREAKLDAREHDLESENERLYVERNTQPASNTPTPAQDDVILQRQKSLLADYEAILRKNPHEVYWISDINANGFPELWITYRYGKHLDNLIHVYHSEKGHAREIYTTAEGRIAPTSDGRVLIYSNQNGSGCLRRFNYNGTSVSSEVLHNHNIPSDRSIPATNFGPLRSAFKF